MQRNLWSRADVESAKEKKAMEKFSANGTESLT